MSPGVLRDPLLQVHDSRRQPAHVGRLTQKRFVRACMRQWMGEDEPLTIGAERR